MDEDSRIFLGIGSNIDDRYLNIKKGIYLIDSHPHVWIINKSHIYESTPMYNLKQTDYYNMVIQIETNFEPLDLLKEMKIIEKKVGRELNKVKNMPRELDIDILAMGDMIINSNILKIPHPYIPERKFVLKPWNDIGSNFIIPSIGENIKSLLDLTNDSSSVRRVLILE